MSDDYVYGYRAVAFLDVLGFSSVLDDFESEAIQNEVSKYVSKRACEFINIFKSGISLLDSNKYNCYLFSDNICITASCDNDVDLRDMLYVINSLYYHFAKNGYFLRGGIDYGLFIDEKSIAIGVPLREAYKLECAVAVYPRIILSNSFVDQFKSYGESGEVQFLHYIDKYIMLNSCEIYYLNIFIYVLQSDNREFKEDFFRVYNNAIIKGLEQNRTREAVYLKYKWIADQFNDFIDSFTQEIAFNDPDFDAESNGFIDFVLNHKIKL